MRSPSPRHTDTPLLTVCNLTCRFASGGGVEDISLELPAGSLTIITGPVGAGKTTLLRAILGLLPRQQGEIYWQGRRVAGPANFFVPPRAAYTSQVPASSAKPCARTSCSARPPPRTSCGPPSKRPPWPRRRPPGHRPARGQGGEFMDSYPQ